MMITHGNCFCFLTDFSRTPLKKKSQIRILPLDLISTQLEFKESFKVYFRILNAHCSFLSLQAVHTHFEIDFV